MQSRPLKPILSSMSCSMQSVFRRHICWASHMSITQEKGSPLVLILQPLFCFLTQEQQVAIASELPRTLLGNL